jgi:digeranylgeranylglycerophospholipid reductase
MDKIYDVIVVGAGFAGLASARAVANHGLRVAVIDRQSGPGARIRTTGILVKEAAELAPVPPNLTGTIHRIRLYAPDLRRFDLVSPGYYFMVTRTAALMKWYARRAEAAGVDILWNRAFTGARRGPDAIDLDGGDLRSRYLIGADGARSNVARQFHLGLNRRYLVGAEAEFEGVREVDECLHVFVDNRLAPGYIGWVVPSLDGVTQVGLACRAQVQPPLGDFIKKAARVFDFSEARIVGRRGGPIPVGGRVAPFAGERVLLTGDAAGLVSPLTAGGIHTGLYHGRLAGRVVARYLDGEIADPGAVLAREYPNFPWKGLMRRVADRGVPDPLVNTVLGFKPVRRIARLIFFHNRGLASVEAWRELFRSEERA